MRIGFVTIGQSPRDDIVGLFQVRLPGIEIEQAGALDDVPAAEVDRLAPAPTDDVLVTRLRSGRDVTIGKQRILGLMQRRIDELAACGADSIVVLCTGPFPELTAPVPLVLPDQVLGHFVAGVLPHGRLGVIAPVIEQIPLMRQKWAAYDDLVIRAANPYGDPEGVQVAAADMTNCALLVLDCMGFGPAAHAAAAAYGRPVLVAQEVLAHTVELLAGVTASDLAAPAAPV